MDKDDTNRIVKENAIKQVGELYEKKEGIEKEYGYLFKDGVESLYKRPTQYLINWIA